MEKIKVGDKVTVKRFDEVSQYFGIPRYIWDKYEGKTFTICKLSISGSFYFAEDDAKYICPVEAVTPALYCSRKIVVLQDGTTTRAIEYEGRRKVKEAMAKLHPNDEYMWETGRDLALNRLIYGTDYHPSEVALQKEEKPLYNGKVVCVDLCGFNCFDYTVGKVYQFEDGFMHSDRGIELPANPVHSFDEWVILSGSKWIEIVE